MQEGGCRSRRIRVRLFSADPGIRFAGHGAQAWVEDGISIHPGPDQVIVSSPDNLHLLGLDPHLSHTVWTLTRCGNRVAITLHLFLNDPDQDALAAASVRANNLRRLFLELEGSPVLAPLEALFRP